jgi:hypothetical protein
MPRVRSQPSRGYLLTVAPALNPTTRLPVTRVLLETTQSFATFQYDLAVTEIRSGQQIRYHVQGLRVPQTLLPSSGPAKFEREYDNLAGTIEMIFEGIDRKPIVTQFDISDNRVRIRKGPPPGLLQLQRDHPSSTTSGRKA